MKLKRIFAVLLSLAAALSLLAGCGGSDGLTINSDNEDTKALSREAAVEEVAAYYRDINPKELQPQLDTDADFSAVAALSDIDTFPVTTTGRADVVVEIAASTEISATEEPDNWLNVVAGRFNREGHRLADGRSVAVSVRKIASGEAVTYMVDGNYRPDGFIPSHDKWGEMLQSRGIEVVTITERLAGNTAGILMKKDVFEAYTDKYGAVTVAGVMDATLNGDLVFATTNPYTSSTGMNILVAMLEACDPDDPLGENAVAKLTDYQLVAPTAAYTTAVMRESARKGIVSAMAMEEQAFTNSADLKGYVYTPIGFRHDHPCYTFGYVDADKQEALRLFAEYCLGQEQQKLATERGFNLHDDYAGQSTTLKGGDFFSAQSVWKKNKNGGRPVIAVFVADVSGSMNGRRLNALKSSLLNTMQFIDADNYIGLVSYDDQVYVNLPVARFDNTQRAYFSGAVKNLSANGGTATYSATAVGTQMLLEASKGVPDAQLMLFVLSDGDTNTGYRLSAITPALLGLGVPVYTIGYETDTTSGLKQLANLNEAAFINASVEVIVNELRNLFNVNM